MAATTAKAWTIESQAEDLSGLAFKDVTVPQELGEHDVLVDMKAASFNYRELVVCKVYSTDIPLSSLQSLTIL